MVDNDPFADPQSAAPTAPKKQRMSGCMLASLIVGGTGLVVILICCGGGIWFGTMFVPTVSKAPAEVANVGKQVLNTDVPEGFSPDNSVVMDNMFFTMRIAQYKQKEGKGEMMMGMMKIKFGDPKQAMDQSRQFRVKFEDEVRGSLEVKKTESREITVNGQKVSVSIGEGVDQNSGKAGHVLSGDFELPSGRTFVLIRTDDDVWDEEAILKMLEDAKAP